AAITTVKNSCWELYRRIGDKTKASLRRVLHRVFCLKPHRPYTMNGGVYESLAVNSSRDFGSKKVPGVPSAAASKRQPEVATNWILL
ncbi:hypothetical protein N7527_006212, partial [Penicillium freii]